MTSLELQESHQIFARVTGGITSHLLSYKNRITSLHELQEPPHIFAQVAEIRKKKFPMTNQGALKSSKALEGIHGVCVVPHSPIISKEIKVGELPQRSCKKGSAIVPKQEFYIQKLWNKRPTCFRPIHSCVSGDKSVAETAANVLTSLPFIAVGLQAPRKNRNCDLYAKSLVGVGIASSLYHASRGELRKYLRWADYTMIAVTTVCLSRALRDENPKLLMAASALLLPIQPIMVSALNTGIMEVSFAKRASQNPQLKKAHNMHKMSSIVAGALFAAEDVFPKTSYIHAGWHLAAAAALSTCNKILE